MNHLVKSYDNGDWNKLIKRIVQTNLGEDKKQEITFEAEILGYIYFCLLGFMLLSNII
jgi:hypothetical protein